MKFSCTLVNSGRATDYGTRGYLILQPSIIDPLPPRTLFVILHRLIFSTFPFSINIMLAPFFLTFESLLPQLHVWS